MTWGKLTEFDNLDIPIPQQVSGHIGFLIQCWCLKGITGQALWSKYTDEFEEWEKEQWAQVPSRIAKYLRTYLLSNGVFVNTDGARITANLERTTKRPSFRAWTTDEINTQMGQKRNFARIWKIRTSHPISRWPTSRGNHRHQPHYHMDTPPARGYLDSITKDNMAPYRQSYERRELHEVCWIHGNDNLADALTEGTPNRSLERFINGNNMTVRVEGRVSRQA